MKCHEFEAIIISMARGQLVEAAARETALAHLDRCDRCASAFEEQRALNVGIRVATESLANQGASPRVEMALRRAFREQVGRSAPRRINLQPPEIWRWSRLAIGAAAAILLLAFLAGTDWLKSPPAKQKREATSLTATPPISVHGEQREKRALAEGKIDQNQKIVGNSAGSRRLSKRQGVRRNVENANEVAPRFYLLVEEGEMAPLESGVIVRVETPASTLISFGLPITAENINRPVQADLLLGQDGLARAIRFLP